LWSQKKQSISVPRAWFEVQSNVAGTFVIRNLHGAVPLPLGNDESIACGASRLFEREVLIDFGSGLAVRFSPESVVSADENEYRTLNSVPPVPGHSSLLAIDKTIGQLPMPEANNIANFLRVALDVVQKAAGSDAFFQAAVAATTQIVSLDRTVLILLASTNETLHVEMSCTLADDWWVAAEHSSDRGAGFGTGRPISKALINRVTASRSTVIHDPLKAKPDLANAHQDMTSPSLQNVECAVASPVLSQDRKVIGILYGDRQISAVGGNRNGIADFEATLVEILAGSVAGGIARQAEEKNRTRLAEFFSPKVAKLLATQPELMEGQDAEVSVLFCDIRGFSSVTEQLGPKKAIAWINDVMSELSQCVIDRDGVLVDYVGDELLAMWGAPGEQLDHASRAIETARAMLGAIETLRKRWHDVLPQRFGAGIGVNTGPAQVGNVGSRQKFKYGPLGNTVNLGSRLQSATKQFGVDCLISRETAIASDCVTSSRRLAKLTVAGIAEPVEVFQIVRNLDDDWAALAEGYQLALAEYENQKFREAARRLGALLPRFPDDRPCRKLLARSVAELDEPSTNFDGVWRLTSK
jgi:adenylate cyclase